MEKYLTQQDTWEGLGPPQVEIPIFVDSPWQALPFMRNGWELVEEKVVGKEDGRDEELWLLCKMEKTF